MSVEIPVSFVQKWRDDYVALSQQKGSRLRPHVRVQSGIKGKADNWERIGSTVASQITSRHAATPLVSTPHSRRRCSLGDWNVADLIDSADKDKTYCVLRLSEVDPGELYDVGVFLSCGGIVFSRDPAFLSSLDKKRSDVFPFTYKYTVPIKCDDVHVGKDRWSYSLSSERPKKD